MLDDPAIGGGARMVENMFKTYLTSPGKDVERLVDYARRMRNGAIFKRLGFLFERSGVSDSAMIEKIHRQLTWGNAKLDPALPADRLVTRWRLWVPTGKTERAHD